MQSDALTSDGHALCGVSVVVPTYRREAVLVGTLERVLALDPPAAEVIVVDQTECPGPETAAALGAWEAEGRIRWLRHSPPSIPNAMNAGALAARCEWILFLDDDIVPDPGLAGAHLRAAAEHPEAWVLAGRVVQPEDRSPESEVRGSRSGGRKEGAVGEKPKGKPHGAKGLRRGLDFAFNGTNPAWVENAMAGNLCVRRDRFLAVGGFDENFLPPVSFRFETEFAKRLTKAGGRIWFEPRASVLHLRAGSGGTRARGGHMASASPLHGAGDYYYALRQGRGWGRIGYMARRPFREVRTTFHLRHPWWIPVKLVGEFRAMAMACRLHRSGPRLIGGAH